MYTFIYRLIFSSLVEYWICVFYPDGIESVYKNKQQQGCKVFE